MTRLRSRLARLSAESRPMLVVYLTFGDPSPEASVDLCERVAEAGADVIELGVPFSDPSADGIVIQAAMQRALSKGAGMTSALEAVAALRRRGCEVPVVLFGYYNPIAVRGVEAFARRCAEVGVDAVLTVDLPIGQLDELRLPLLAEGVDVVPLIAPTTGDDRIAKLAEIAPPFVYCISMTGTTGAAFTGTVGGGERMAAIRAAASAPVALGFGIKTADDARAASAISDGVVVGSAVVQRIADAPSEQAAVAAVGEFIAELRAAIDGGAHGADTTANPAR